VSMPGGDHGAPSTEPQHIRGLETQGNRGAVPAGHARPAAAQHQTASPVRAGIRSGVVSMDAGLEPTIRRSQVPILSALPTARSEWSSA